MDGKRFISDVESMLVPISPIIQHAIRKQLADMGTAPEFLTPDSAMDFIGRMTGALDMFLGKDRAEKERGRMMSLLRKQVPEYFERRSLI